MKRILTARRLPVIALTLLLAGLALPGSHAQEPKAPTFQLQLPIACQVGKNCWIFNYFDQDPGPEALDYHQGHRTYNDHDGIDFGLRDLRQMKDGVSVLAAAPGVVRYIRNGEVDLLLKDKPFPTHKECGNGILLEHANGYTTQYCHLKNDSIRVQVGDQVQVGQILGQVGLSGMTEFPHVHLTLRYHGQALDPFTKSPAIRYFEPEPDPTVKTEKILPNFWAPELAGQLGYHTGILYHHGISDKPEEAETIRGDHWTPPKLDTQSPILNAWVDILGSRAGDSLTIQVTNPAGKTVFNGTLPIPHNLALNFYQARLTCPPEGWLPGTYTVRYLYHTVNGRTESVTDQLRL